MSGKLIVGNWKMNPPTLKEAEGILRVLARSILKFQKTQIVLCPPVIYFQKLKNLSRKISLGAQDAFWEEKGSYTGEISAEMLSNLGLRYVILGHSERRARGETNEEINKKIRASLSAGLRPIFCVGERERDAEHKYLNFIRAQIWEGLEKVSKDSLTRIVVAYEPRWAIGKGAVREAKAEEFLEMAIFIRKVLTDKFKAKTIPAVKIIYGGSVHSKNAFSFLKEGGADGLLVGRDSLESKKFLEILKICDRLEK